METRARVAAAIRKHGAAHVARVLGLSREAVLAFGGDFHTQVGTAAIIEQRAVLLSEIPKAA